MIRTFMTADLHFGDPYIMKYEHRPFETSHEMDECMISQWNNLVALQDVVYVVGDFGAEGYEAKILNRLNGTKYLIRGNHDIRSNEFYRQAGFKEVYDHPIILDKFWILSHKPLYVNDSMPYANIFGHVHRSPAIKDYSQQHYCVSYDRLGSIAIDFDTIKTIVKNHPDMNDTWKD